MFRLLLLPVCMIALLSSSLAQEKDATSAVKGLQTALKGLGYYSGSVDGQYGDDTRDGLLDFIWDHNKATGKKLPREMNSDTISALVNAGTACLLAEEKDEDKRTINRDYCFKLSSVQKRNDTGPLRDKHREAATKLLAALQKCNVSQFDERAHWITTEFVIKTKRVMDWEVAYLIITGFGQHLLTTEDFGGPVEGTKSFCDFFKRDFQKGSFDEGMLMVLRYYLFVWDAANIILKSDKKGAASDDNGKGVK